MEQNAARKPVLIIGSGISGLSLAQGLRKAKIPFLVFEKDAAFESRSQGYRFGLAEPGVHALQANLSDELFDKFKRSCGAASAKGPPATIQAVAGQEVENNFATMFSGKKGHPGSAANKHSESGAKGKKPGMSVKVDRRVLRTILLKGIESQVHFGKAFKSYEETNDGVNVTFNDGATVTGSALVGADGGWSRVRQQMRPKFSLRDCETRPILGKTRVTPELLENLDTTVAQNFTFLASSPFTGMTDNMFFDRNIDETPDDYIFWVLFLKPEHYPNPEAVEIASRGSEEALSLARQVTKHWKPSIRCLFEQPDVGASQLQNCTGTPGQLAVNGHKVSKVTLIGDAAHMMAPTGGTGALIALRDAAVLASKLGRDGVNAQAFRDYEIEMLEYANEAYQRTLEGGRAIFKFKDYEQMPIVKI